MYINITEFYFVHSMNQFYLSLYYSYLKACTVHLPALSAFSGHGSVSIPECMHIVHLYRARERFWACEWFTRGLLPVPGVSPSQHILATRGKNKCSQVRWMYRCVAYYMLTRQGYLQSISQSIGQCVSE